MKNVLKKFIGDKAFYRMVMMVAIPIMIQNGVTNFVSLLDNILGGQIGTLQLFGVAIVNQLLFVYNMCVFGGLSGAGIFGAQFYGQRNEEGIRYTFRFKLWVGAITTLIGFVLLICFDDPLIMLYLHDGAEAGEAMLALPYAKEYLHSMLVGLIPFLAVQIYASTLRETGETFLPMKAGIVAVFVNLIFNYLLIFGHFGFPEMGVKGAAIATVLSCFVEAGIVIIWTHKHKAVHGYIRGAYRSLYIPKELVRNITVKGMPLLVNEAFWASGMAILLQCYSVRGLEVVAGMNITSTITNLFNIVFIALGQAVAIIVGRLLGAGKMEEAKETDTKLIAFSVTCCVFVGTVLYILAPLFPDMYNTEPIVKEYATQFIRIAACFMPQTAFLQATYFTMRSGGRTIITSLFDSGFIWILSIPLAFVLSRYTALAPAMVYFLCQAIDIVKTICGFILLKKGVWVQNIVEKKL